MKASDIRKITDSSLSTESLKPVLDYVYSKMSARAQEGFSTLDDPFRDFGDYDVDEKFQEAVVSKLRADGFGIVSLPSSGHVFGTKLTISW